MNREIKFRAWDSDGSGMYENVCFYPNANYQTMNLMQFAGLHDKNGVEIYEGDVVADNRNEKYEVVFDNINLCYSGKCLKTLELFQLNKNNVLMVLGNKYSNTELLKKDGK